MPPDLVTKSCLTLVTPWTVASQAPLPMVILQARILKWVAIHSSRGSFQLRDQTQVFCTAGRFFTVELPGKLLEEAKKLHVLFHLEPSSSFLIVHIVNMGFPRASDVKNMPMMKEAWI